MEPGFGPQGEVPIAENGAVQPAPTLSSKTGDTNCYSASLLFSTSPTHGLDFLLPWTAWHLPVYQNDTRSKVLLLTVRNSRHCWNFSLRWITGAILCLSIICDLCPFMNISERFYLHKQLMLIQHFPKPVLWNGLWDFRATSFLWHTLGTHFCRSPPASHAEVHTAGSTGSTEPARNTLLVCSISTIIVHICPRIFPFFFFFSQHLLASSTEALGVRASYLHVTW
jgi:hypothetical protein